MDVATVVRSCYKNNAYEMMVHMLMWMHRCKANTWVVIALPLIKISYRDLKVVPFFIKSGIVVL
jgi:hypothetical protein